MVCGTNQLGESMEALTLARVGGRYYTLRGLLLLPTGLIFLAAGLFNTPPIGDEPVSGGAPWFVVALALAAVGYVAFNRYYATTFGRVEPSKETLARITIYTVVGAALICLGITLDMQLDLPVSLFGTAYGVSLLLYYRMLDVLRPYHLALLGALCVLALTPVWGHAHDPVSLAMIPMGLVTMAVGWCDHRYLIGSLRDARSARVDEDVHGRS
jgi:phosphatidylglycerophosphate synthase